jgi:glycosyltransferase involved in cell wall biosynthesis
MIPTYNQAAFLPKAIASALGQDYANLEVVVADDCSSDGTGEAVQGFLGDGRLKFFRNSTNLGRVGNYRNTLEHHATGEWVINLDADDYYTDLSFVSKAMNFIGAATSGEASGDIVFLQAGHTVKDRHGVTIRTDLPDTAGDVEEMTGTRYFLGFHHFSHLATVFNRKKALTLDFYRYNILSSDIESFLRLALHGRVILWKTSVGDWVHHGANESKKLDIPTVEANMLRIEAPYVYAKSLRLFSDDELLGWRNRLTKTYIRSYLILSLKNRGSLDGYLGHVIRGYPQVVFGMTIPAAVAHALVSKIRRFFAREKDPSEQPAAT